MKYRPFWIIDPEDRATRRRRRKKKPTRVYLWDDDDPGPWADPEGEGSGEKQKEGPVGQSDGTLSFRPSVRLGSEKV